MGEADRSEIFGRRELSLVGPAIFVELGKRPFHSGLLPLGFRDCSDSLFTYHQISLAMSVPDMHLTLKKIRRTRLFVIRCWAQLPTDQPLPDQ